MKFFTVVIALWFLSALCRSAKQVHAQRVAQREAARRSAQLAQLTADFRRQKAEAQLWTQQQLLNERAMMLAQRQAALEAKAQERARKDAERAAKREFEREQAMNDMEHYALMRSEYTDLIEALTREMKSSTTTERRQYTLRRQVLQLEERVYRLDQRRAKAYYKAQEAC